MTIGHEPTVIDKVGFTLVIGALVLLGVVLLQPIWRGDAMLAQLTRDCKLRGGVLIDDKGLLGDTYSCESRLDK